jgi:Zn-dependent protease with chaperone function
LEAIVAKRSRAAVSLFVLTVVAFAAGPKELKPGWNLFSKEQDVQLGREAAAQVEAQMPVVRDASLSEYVQRIGQRLASAPEADRYPYTFKVINDPNINAFALPGGPTYVHTGLIRAAENEAQLAGVMAHEIAHVALRHGTHQASKANAIQLPAMILGGLLGGGGGMLGQLAQLGVGLGANSVLLKFSRDAERDADRLGARIMARAGYNPIEMARFFEKLQSQGGGGGPQFLSSHPDPGNRIEVVQEEISFMPQRQYTAGDSNALRSIQSRLGSLPSSTGVGSRGRAGVVGTGDPRPSGRFREFRGNGFSISHPDNWEVFGGDGGSVTIAPRAGLVQDNAGGVAVGYGVIASYANAYHENNLRDATADLIGQLRQSNPGLQAGGRQQSYRLDGQNALVTTLYNQSPLGGREVDMLVTVQARDGLFYMVFIAPEGDFRNVQPVFEQMLRTVRLR